MGTVNVTDNINNSNKIDDVDCNTMEPLSETELRPLGQQISSLTSQNQKTLPEADVK